MTGNRAYFMLERFPRISDGIGSFHEWVELFPGVRLWWHEETYNDRELLKSCLNEEHYFALRWVELRSRRLNNGFVCELEIIPDETKRFFIENDLSSVMIGEVNVQKLFSIFASCCLLLNGYNSQMRSCGSLNYSWRFITDPDNESPTQIEFETELTTNDWWADTTEIKTVEVRNWETILPIIWMAGYTMFSDETGKYSDFLENYVIAMQTEEAFERNLRFCRCLETLCRGFSGGIGENLRQRVPFLLPHITDPGHMKSMDVSEENALEQKKFTEELISKSWKLRSKYVHGQTLEEKHHSDLMQVLADFPTLLYWVNRGIIFLSRIPNEDEFNQAKINGLLNWYQPPKWKPLEQYVIEDNLYRIDGTYIPKLIEKYKSIGGKDRMTYDEFLDLYGDGVE
jgi:muconolactone delta-isomerase